MNSKRIDKLPLSGARQTTFKLLRGLLSAPRTRTPKKKGVLLSVCCHCRSSVIRSNFNTPFSLIDFSLPQIVLNEILLSVSLAHFFSPFLLHHWQLSNNESWMSQCIRRRQGGGCARKKKKRGFGPLVSSRMERACKRVIVRAHTRAPPSRRSFALIHLHAHSSDTRAADSWGQKYNHEQRTVASFVLYCFLWLRAAAAAYIYI